MIGITDKDLNLINPITKFSVNLNYNNNDNNSSNENTTGLNSSFHKEGMIKTSQITNSQSLNNHPFICFTIYSNESKFAHLPVYSNETFDSKMTFEKHLRSVSRAASQRFGILRKSGRVFASWEMLSGLVLSVLEYCSAVWCSAADGHLKLLDRAVSGARFLTASVFECDIAHRRSVAVLCMLYKIRCNPMNPLNGALPAPYMCQCGLHAVLWSHIGTLMQRLAAEPRSTA